MNYEKTIVRPDRFRSAAAAGLRVFPLQSKGKKPLHSWKQYRDAAASAEDIAEWDQSDLNVAFVTGVPSGIIVIDADNQEAVDFLETLNLPLTASVRTGRGMHFYFRHPGYEISNTVAIDGRKLDVRGDGGYVVGAGSIHPSGARYEWVHTPEVGFADLPPVLLDLLKTATVASTGSSEDADRETVENRFATWLFAELDLAAVELASATEGNRNDTLFRLRARIASHVAGADADWAPFAKQLTNVALGIGLTSSEVEATLVSSWKAGQEQPTAWMLTAREWIYLAKQDVFHHLESGQYIKRDAFSTTYASQRIGKMGTFARFLTDHRYVQIVHDLTFEPTNPDRYIERDGLLWLNTYNAPGIVAEAGDWSRIAEFIAYLVPNDNERTHLLRAMAWTIRNPGVKLKHAIMIRSQKQGVGKSMLGEIWGTLIGISHVKTTTTEEIVSDYNGFIPGTLLLIVEELNYGVGLSFYNRLKEYITGTTIRVNEKFIAQREWPNHMIMLINTNMDIPMLIQKDDRRLNYIDTPAEPRDPSYYMEFAAWWRGNLGIVRAFFENVDLEDFNPNAPPPMTEAKSTLIADSRTPVVRDIELEIEERAGVFDRDVVTVHEIRRQLSGTMQIKSNVQLTKALQNLGAVNIGQHRTPGSGQRRSLWIIRNHYFWLSWGARACAEESVRFVGLLSAWEGLPFVLGLETEAEEQVRKLLPKR